MKSLNHVAPAAARQRAAFIRQAVKDAIRRREYAQIREAYLRDPDSAAEADDWSSAVGYALGREELIDADS